MIHFLADLGNEVQEKTARGLFLFLLIWCIIHSIAA
jgi:hypothetical protein